MVIPGNLEALLRVVLVKKTFNLLVFVCYVLIANQASAQEKYETWLNGEIHQVNERLYVKVILSSRLYRNNHNRLSIARLFGQRNILRYPYNLIEWDDQYSDQDQRILTNNYLRLVKLTGKINGFRTERQWIKDGHYHFSFSAPSLQIIHTVTSTDIITPLQRAVNQNSTRLNHVAILEIALRHPALFNIKSVVSQFNNHYGKNLLRFMTGEEVSDMPVWRGGDNALSALKLEELLQLQSQYPYDNNISYYLALVLQGHQYIMLLRRVLENGLKVVTNQDSYTRLKRLADELGVVVQT